MTCAGEIERGHLGTVRLGPMILDPNSGAPPEELEKSRALNILPCPPPTITSDNIPDNYDYYDFECSPLYYKENFILSGVARNFINDIDLLYWNQPDLTRVDRWILRNLLSCAITRQSPNDPAKLVADHGKKEITKRCEEEKPEWEKGMSYRLKLIMK